MIRHFTHPHPLTLSKPPWREAMYDFNECNLCHGKFHESDQIYSCPQMLCHYYMHRSCALSEEKISHPFHPQHKLKLLKAKKKYFFRCRACWDTFTSKYAYNYYCDSEECMYALDLKCAALIPIKVTENLINHQHPLVLCDKPSGNDYRYTCSRVCGEVFDDYDRVCVCQECHCLLHESCAALPSEVRHPFHPEHPLILLPVAIGRSWCDVCGKPCYPGNLLYHCSLCRFTMDVHCITLKPTSKNSDTDTIQEHLPIAHPHPHPLIQCGLIKNFRRHCFGCNLPFEDFVYACFECGILLHKSCADIPTKIVHPFHPQHPLILGKDSAYRCQGCDKASGSLVYSCKKCMIALDLKCAKAKPHFILISQVHKHALAFFDFETGKMMCNICRKFCTKFFFRCVVCDFNIHDHCYPLLPQTLKHDCHCDPLVLTRSKIKDFPDEYEQEEFYCFACEELRNLSHPTYYCADCHFIAHVRCVISEILPYLEKKSTALAAAEVENTKLEKPPTPDTRWEASDMNMIFLSEDDQTTEENPVHEATTATSEVDPVLDVLNEKIAALGS